MDAGSPGCLARYVVGKARAQQDWQFRPQLMDPRSKLDVQTFIEEINQTHDATIVLTTHDLAEAERLCARITVLNDGRIIAEGTPDELKAQTASRLGREATLEDVFMTYTGRSLDDDVEKDGSDDDD